MTDYTRLAEIRSGKETVVWLGKHPVSGKGATIKEPSPDLPAASRPRVVSKLQREMKFLDNLSNPRILRPAQWDESGGRLILEETQGSLHQLLAREGRLDVDLVARVMTDCLTGLAYLHDRKIAHGTLCPWSVLIGPGCDIKLGDFTGFRIDLGEAPVPPPYLLKYQAPELVRAAATADPPAVRAARIDLYSLGYLGCELLAGRDFDRLFWPSGVPEGDANWLRWHGDAREEPPLRDVLTSVPESMLDILNQLIRLAPDRRPSSARDVQSALEKAGLISNRKLPRLDGGGKPEPAPGPVAPDGARVVRVVKKCPLELWTKTSPVHHVRFKPGKPNLIGLVRGCRFKLPLPNVSEKHALVVCQDTGQWWVYDLLSRTGVRVNGKAVAAARLGDEDRLEIAGQEFVVRENEAAPPDIRTSERRSDQFELVRRIHTGQEGSEFYLARWRHDGRAAVVRVFPRSFAANPEDIHRLIRGVPEVGEIRHPNIVRLYRAGACKWNDTRTWFVATEYLAGRSLRERLGASGRPLAVDEVVRFGIDICSALEVVAERRLVHRNVNPACILFGGDGEAKLGDFFLLREQAVQTLHQITRAGTPVGEVVYQAPEVLAGERELPPSADLYSLAACMYHALTRRPPFDPAPLLDLVKQVNTQQPPNPRQFNPAVPEKLADLVLWALAKDAAARPESAKLLRGHLEHLAPSVPIPRPPKPTGL